MWWRGTNAAVQSSASFLLDGVSKKEMNEKKKKEEEGEGEKKARAMVEQLEMMGKDEWERETAN